MAVDKEAGAYRESTHIVILSVPCPYIKGRVTTMKSVIKTRTARVTMKQYGS